MRIYERCVIDIETGEILEEESFEYQGPIAWCGSSGGGGSITGKVDYPGYMKDIHKAWLTGSGLGDYTRSFSNSDFRWDLSASGTDEYLLLSDTGGDPLVEKPNTLTVCDDSYAEGTIGSLAQGEWDYGQNDGYSFNTIYIRLLDADSQQDSSGTVTSRDPDDSPCDIEGTYSVSVEVANADSITGLLSDRIGKSPYSGKSAYDPDSRLNAMDSAVSDFKSRIDNLQTVDAVEQQIAQFDAAMRDINAVNTSNFVIGRAIIAGGFIETKMEAKNNLASLKIETNRIAITAKSEQTDTDRKIDVKDALWDMQIYQLGGNIMASIGGGTVAPRSEEGPTETRSAIGGALSGAAAGASIGAKAAKGTSYEGQGGKYGAAIGGVLGIAAALYGS